MTIRTNLATRPFYNERAVQIAVIVLAVLVAAATAYNAVHLYSLTARESAVAAEIREAESRAQQLQRETARARAGLDTRRVAQVADAAAEANRLIDLRVFSWTALFNRFEATMPANVRVTAVTPGVAESGGRIVTMAVEGRSVADIDRFLEALEATGAFSAMLAREERETDEGLIEATLRGGYHPDAGAAEAPVPAADRREP